MSNILKDLVDEIKFRKKWNIEQVAKSIGYSRVYLNKEMNKGNNEELLKLLKEKHADILQPVTNAPKTEIQILLDNNRILAESLMLTAQAQVLDSKSIQTVVSSNETLVKTNSDLAKYIITGAAHQETPVVGSSISPGLRELLLDIGLKSGKWRSKQEGLAELSIAFPAVVSKKKVKSTHPD